MPYDNDNIFAKIIRKEAPAYLVEENDHCLTMMDIMPQSKGHTLVIPKEPSVNILDVSDRGLEHLILQTRRVARAVDMAFEPEGVMIVQLNRAGAGQSVFHLHFHVIPRWGGLQMAFHSRNVEDSSVLEDHAERIRGALASF
ncbi:MAG: HIT family protein [Gammaproteobacteria bacterium]|nr:HIT family protein [Gammaproteobacteria bacterium]